jgi:clathrin heavy chain
VLILYIGDIPRAAEYALKYNVPEIWTKLGSAYLEKAQIVEAMDSFLKSRDPS